VPCNLNPAVEIESKIVGPSIANDNIRLLQSLKTGLNLNKFSRLYHLLCPHQASGQMSCILYLANV